eukprot:3258987-Prymnesium_polylepis.1
MSLGCGYPVLLMRLHTECVMKRWEDHHFQSRSPISHDPGPTGFRGCARSPHNTNERVGFTSYPHPRTLHSGLVVRSGVCENRV